MRGLAVGLLLVAPAMAAHAETGSATLLIHGKYGHYSGRLGQYAGGCKTLRCNSSGVPETGNGPAPAQRGYGMEGHDWTAWPAGPGPLPARLKRRREGSPADSLPQLLCFVPPWHWRYTV
jgi:hypothetical protein